MMLLASCRPAVSPRWVGTQRAARLVALVAQGRHSLCHLVALLLPTLVRAEALLRQLQCTLERGRGADLEQLDHPALIGGEACDLAHHLADEAVAGTLPALAVGRLGGQLPARHDEALVQAGCKACGLRLRGGGLLPHGACVRGRLTDVDVSP